MDAFLFIPTSSPAPLTKKCSFIKYLRDKIVYASDQLIEYFTCRGEGRLNTKDAEIFTSFLQSEISKLKEWAREIDAEYGAG